MSKCSECGKVNDGYCKPCNSTHWRDNFSNWTSGDTGIDELIQDLQQNANERWETLEWIEYSNLENIEHIADGGFGSVYKAVWKDGPIKEERIRKKKYLPWLKDKYMHHCWDMENSKWYRHNNWLVAIKKYRKATNMSSEFLREMRNGLNLNLSDYVNRIYGVTRDSQTHEYAIVTAFQNGGNLRRVISENRNKITWKKVIFMLRDISRGLADIHSQDYHHKDFHSGNILNSIYGNIYPMIGDFGLSRPTNESTLDKTVYGVLPFVASEVLLSEKYSKAADVYGLGMIMYEILLGEPPFFDEAHDQCLALAICLGKRPPIPEYAPEPYTNFMKKCWDPIPANRPTADEMWNIFSYWSSMNRDDLQKIGFTYEQENQWKARLKAIKENPRKVEQTHNFYTSKSLCYSDYLMEQLQKKTSDDCFIISLAQQLQKEIK